MIVTAATAGNFGGSPTSSVSLNNGAGTADFSCLKSADTARHPDPRGPRVHRRATRSTFWRAMRILSDDPGRSGARAASGIIDDVTSAKYSLIASLALAAMSAHAPLLEVVLSLLRAASGVIALPDVNHTVPSVLLNISFGRTRSYSRAQLTYALNSPWPSSSA